MGMDVCGKNPVAEKGEYFRNSVWWWRPLATYICEVAPVPASVCTYWQSNDGDGLNAKDSLALALILRREIASGRTAEYMAAREKKLADLPLLSCQWCEGTGTRRDAVGIANGMVERKWCNGCDGTGTQAYPDTHYPFSVENVSEFCDFLESCGGFEIN